MKFTEKDILMRRLKKKKFCFVVRDKKFLRCLRIIGF